MRARAIFDCYESWRCESDSKFWSLKFADFSPEFSWIKFDVIVGSRAGCFLVGEVPGDGVDGFGPHGI
jgi:hypothetical protein